MGRLLTALGRVLRGLTGGTPQAGMTEDGWPTCAVPVRMLEFVDPWTSDRKLRLFCVACGRGVWHLLEDERGRHALEVAERYAGGLAGAGELAAARAAARRASDAAPPGAAA